jgi:hypothetical protein
MTPMDGRDERKPVELAEGETGLFMHDIELRLRRRADKKIRHALQIAALLIEGYRPGEIRRRLGIDATQYARAHRWLTDALGPAIERTPGSAPRRRGQRERTPSR